jgi:hypothetical protein
MPEAEQQLHKLRASMDHETWEELSQENELRSKFRKFKTSDNIINQIILSRIAELLKEKYLKKFVIVHTYNDKGVMSCAMACERKPLDIAIWCPDEQAIMGNIAYQILLCQQHGAECRKNTALLNIFVDKIAKPFWIESGLGLDMSEFIVFTMMLKKLTNGEYWILIFDTKRFFRINEKLLKYYNHAAHEDYIVCPTKIFNLNTPPSDTIFIITAMKSIMSTEQLEANVDVEYMPTLLCTGSIYRLVFNCIILKEPTSSIDSPNSNPAQGRSELELYTVKLFYNGATSSHWKPNILRFNQKDRNLCRDG